MIISKTGTLRLLRILGVFCALTMGFLTLVGTSEDDATNALGVDDDFDETADVELDEVTTTEADTNASAVFLPLAGNCSSLTVNQALEDLEAKGDIDDLDKLDIGSITLQYISGSYTAGWTPDTLTQFNCRMSISGAKNTTIGETVINGASGNIDDTLTQEQIDVINYYLANRNETFTYCASCDADPDTYTVKYKVNINVRIKGDVDVF